MCLVLIPFSIAELKFTVQELLDLTCWYIVDFALCIELKLISFVLVSAEWTKALLVGAQLSRVLDTVLTLSRDKHDMLMVAVIGCTLTLAVAWFVYKLRKRLSLRNRRKRHDVQRKKRWSHKERLTKLTTGLQTKGVSFLLLIHLSYGVHAMDQEQFSQLMQGMGQLITRQEATLRGVAEVLGASSGSATASVAKSLESASKILKTPEQFDPSSDSMAWVTWRHSFLNWLSYADSRFLEAIQDIEKLSPAEAVETVDWTGQE